MEDSSALHNLRDRPFELLAELERRGRSASATPGEEPGAGREWVGVALRMAGELYLAALGVIVRLRPDPITVQLSGATA